MLPQVAALVIRMAGSDQATQKEMEEVLSAEPAIAAKLLRVANTPYYLRGEPATTLERAISVLGITVIKSLVLGLAYNQIEDSGPKSREFDRTSFWQHSVATGAASMVIGTHCLPDKAEELYLAGLLHDVGLLVLDRFMPVELDAAISRARRNKLCLSDVEASLFGWDHAEIGAMLIDSWGLDTMLRDAVLYHDRPEESNDHFTTTAIVSIGNVIAHRCGYRGGCTAELPEAPLDLLDALELTPGQMDHFMEESAEEAEHILMAFAGSSRPTERLARPA